MAVQHGVPLAVVHDELVIASHLGLSAELLPHRRIPVVDMDLAPREEQLPFHLAADGAVAEQRGLLRHLEPVALPPLERPP